MPCLEDPPTFMNITVIEAGCIVLRKEVMKHGYSRLMGLLFLLCGTAFSQVVHTDHNIVPDSNHQRVASPESLLIGSGDLLHVTIFREPDLEQKVRVKDSGEIDLDLAGSVK